MSDIVKTVSRNLEYVGNLQFLRGEYIQILKQIAHLTEQQADLQKKINKLEESEK